MIKAVVLDVEGTVCSIAFVKDVLYPYAINKASEIVPKLTFPLAGSSEIESYLVKFPSDHNGSPSAILDHMKDLTARDIKAPYLKNLQGYLWRSGYESGEIKVDLFKDADLAIRSWSKKLPGGIFIYSSGSVAAQKLLFKHTSEGDLTPLLSGYFDTTNAGPKTEKASYEKIAETVGEPQSILFFSDNPKEIDAAAIAGWNTAWTIRPGNAPAEGYQAPQLTIEEFTDKILN